jgi:hypothetical protein
MGNSFDSVIVLDTGRTGKQGRQKNKKTRQRKAAGNTGGLRTTGLLYNPRFEVNP